MIFSLGADFWISLCWGHMLVLGFCFFSGFPESGMSVCGLYSCGVHREYLLLSEAGIEDESGVQGKEDGEGLCDISGNGVREERESTVVSSSRAGDETGRGVERISGAVASWFSIVLSIRTALSLS